MCDRKSGCPSPLKGRAELLYEIEDEFGIGIPREDMKRMDRSFKAIVRYVASRRISTS
jgi:acyl carrier protein